MFCRNMYFPPGWKNGALYCLCLLILVSILMVLLYTHYAENWYRKYVIQKRYFVMGTKSELSETNDFRGPHGSTTQLTTKARYNNVSVSRLFFSKPITDYWIPSKDMVEDFQLDMDWNPTSKHIGNKTMLIVLPNSPVWFKSLPSMMNDANYGTCTYRNCMLSMNKRKLPMADAVAFSNLGLPRQPPPKPDGQPWVMYVWESPLLADKTMGNSHWRGKINWTMSYTLNSDFFTPVGLFVPIEKQVSQQKLLNTVGKKTKTAAWIVSNCRVHSRRSEYVKRLQKIIDVDILGGCGKIKCPKSGPKCMLTLKHTYRFYLAFENAFCNDYITEKLYKTFQIPIVPVVRGGADYKNLVPPGTYIDTADFASPEELGKYLKKLANDTSAYMDILMKKEAYKVIMSGTVKKISFCELCFRLNNPRNDSKVYENLGNWFNYGKCHSPTDLNSTTPK